MINPSSPSSRDENALVVPDHWRSVLHPRRGGAPGPPVEIDASAAETLDALARRARGTVDQVLAGWPGDAETAARVRRHLDGDADPFGAAVVAEIACGVRDEGTDVVLLAVDAWTAVHGVAFAACAFAEMTQMSMSGETFSFVPPGEYRWLLEPAPRRMRALLAAAGEGEYRDAVGRLASCRRTPFQRVVVGYLVPTEQAWVDEFCSTPPQGPVDYGVRWLVVCAVSTATQVEGLGAWADPPKSPGFLGLLATMADGLGPAAAPIMAGILDERSVYADLGKGAVEVLAALPSDEAFTMLVSRLQTPHARPGVLAAMERFPARAVRVLTEAAAGTSQVSGLAADLLAGHVRSHPGLTSDALPALTPAARTLAESLLAASGRVPEAPAGTLPRLLVEPPWTRPRPKARPFVLKGLTPSAEGAVAWETDEREKWSAIPVGLPSDWVDSGPQGHAGAGPAGPDDNRAPWEARAADFRAGRLDESRQKAVFLMAPDDLARPLLDGWFPAGWDDTSSTADPENWMRPVLARFGCDALPTAVRFARAKPGRCANLLLPFLDAQVAALMADWSLKTKNADLKEVTDAWFARHGTATAPLLLPAALGRPGKARLAAERALLALASAAGKEPVVEAARVHGDEAAAAIAALLERDPQELVPRKIPDTGWADPAALPQVLLRDREHRLPDAAAGHLVTMLAMSVEDGAPHEGVALAGEICDPESLAAFGWELFQRGPGWTLTALGWTGDDALARRLTPLIRTWPGGGGHALAVRGLDALAIMGTDTALAQLNGIALKVKFKGIKARAQEKMREVAAGLGLSAEQLADRLVPDLGLDAEGALTLDYGPRRFLIRFDEQLRPHVADEDGTPRTTLPKPGAKDDPELAPAAHRRFAQLKKDVRAVAATQLLRMETAMTTRRRWTPEEFRTFFVEHPLLWHMARRLVWIAGDGDETTAFRLAEDRSFADAGDDVLALPATTRIGIAHPVDLGAAHTAWEAVFADYEILQPFPQLARPVHALTGEERAGTRLARFAGVTVPWNKVLGLVRRGWERGTAEDNGLEQWISRPLPDGRTVVVDLSPGISVGDVGYYEEQTLTSVLLLDGAPKFYDRTELPFADLDPVSASEVLADLEEVVGAEHEGTR